MTTYQREAQENHFEFAEIATLKLQERKEHTSRAGRTYYTIPATTDDGRTTSIYLDRAAEIITDTLGIFPGDSVIAIRVPIYKNNRSSGAWHIIGKQEHLQEQYEALRTENAQPPKANLQELVDNDSHGTNTHRPTDSQGATE